MTRVGICYPLPMARGSWLVVGLLSIACGGVVARHGGDDDDSTSGGSTSHAGASSTTAGTGTTPTGGSTSVPPTNFGEGQACYNDTDCPNPACGGLVCNWTKQAPSPDGIKIFYCNAAGTSPKGMDGWCTTDADCKCVGRGAKCVGTYCSFTRSADAPQ